MKKIVLTLLILLLPLATFAIRGNIYLNGYWGTWTNLYLVTGNGYINDFVLYYINDHPSQYFTRITISNFTVPSKDEIKYHLKNNSWYEYSGTVEYYVSDAYPTIESILQKGWIYWMDMHPDGYTHYVKRTANASIKIAPYKKEPNVVNIFFDNVGIGIQFQD